MRAVHADVGDVPAGPDQAHRLLEGSWNPDGLHRHVSPKVCGQLRDDRRWIPFGGGVRRCLGAAFAEYEMRILLSTLFDRCTVRPTNERPEPVRRRGITHVPGRGATVVLG